MQVQRRRMVGLHTLMLALLLMSTDRAQSKNYNYHDWKSPPHQVESTGADCSRIKALTPRARSGLYLIQPNTSKAAFKAYCEMRSDGGWTVIQRRSGGAVSFDRDWAAYKKGFGNLRHDHWLGLNKVFAMTRKRNRKWVLRVDLWAHSNATAFAEYRNFHIGSERQKFSLQVGRFSGTAGDALRDQNNSGFSTSDRDNDGCSPCIFGDIAQSACTFSQGGGWWYSRCGSAGLNGDWHAAGEHMGWASGLHWKTWRGAAPYSMRRTRMMIKSV